MLREIGMQAKLPCIALLARLYGDTVMCVADHGISHEGIISSYERGRPMPLTRGATSKMILAELPSRRLRKLLSQTPATRRPFRIKPEELMEELAYTKKRGFCVTRGEIDKDLMGIAAPVVAKDMGIAASLSLVLRAVDIDANIERRLTLLLVSSASLLTADLTNPLDQRHGAAKAG
jgi:DNA-binding IclR family transcriptional regulator